MPAELAAACEDLVRVYDSASGPVHALRGAGAEFPVGSVTVVIGPSGAGKSTLLRLLACLEAPTAGEVWIQGERTAHLSPRRRRQLAAVRVGYVFQRPSDNLLDYLTVAEHVSLAWRMRAPERRGDVDALLGVTDLAGLARRRPPDLSAGEQQRLAFAMSIAADPAVVVADEPTAELDAAGAAALVGLLPVLARHGQTLVISSHDPAIVAAADRVLVIRNGAVAGQLDAGGRLLAVIDSAGRIQLPPDAVDSFPTGRVEITDDGEGGLRLG